MIDSEMLNAHKKKLLHQTQENLTDTMHALEARYEEMPTRETRFKLLAVVRNLRAAWWEIASAIWNIKYLDDFLRRAEEDKP